MFKPARWWSEKNRVKVDFKLQFHASQVTNVGGDGLMISIVPAESGKPTVKSDKATVRDGSCFWDNPVYETVKFNQDPKSGKIHEKIYYFVIETGLSKSGIVGEASIDLSNYAEANKVSLVSLPIKNSKTEATLHVSIQRIQESMDQREIEESENEKLHAVDNHDMDGTIRTNSTDDMPVNKIVSPAELNLNANHRASSGSDVTISRSGSSSGIEAPWEMQMNNDNIHHEPDGYCTDDSLNTPKVNFLSRDSEESPDILIEKLKSDNAALSRRAEMCELELQTLRKQIVKESKRGNDFWREIVELKEERDALKGECDYLKSLKRRTDVGARMKTNPVLDGVDSQAIIEELKQELNHAKELNANLQIQLRKTQESNSELILAVRDLDEMLEQKNKEMFDVTNREAGPTCELDDDDDDDDDEQRALEDLVKEHSDDKEAYLLEQQIVDLRNEIESYKRDKDELEMQMEQLALDYEIMKQANHEMSNRLEQSQIQEQLKMQYECSSSDTSADELEIRMENVENELKTRSKEYTDSLVTISLLEGHAKSLEEELEKQARGFEADLEALTREKVEQEKRAIRAEEMLKKMRWKNANTAERLQEEFRRLSVQMASMFEANERLATNALAEANELRLQKGHLEETLRKSYEEQESIKGRYETRLHQFMNQIEDNAAQLENQKLLSDEILMLRDEIESHVAKNKILSDEMASKKSLMHEVEQMRMLVKEKELLLEQTNDERIELERMVESVKNEADESRKELNEMRCLLKEKEMIVVNLQSEVESLQARCTELKDARLEDETEIEKLRKQVIQLKSDMKKKEDAFNSTEKKIKDGNGRGTTVDVAKATSKTSKPVFRASKEVANLKERIKLLESQIKSKETALESSANKYLEKEKDLHYKIKELEGRLQSSSARFCENEVDKNDSVGKQPASAVVEDQAPNYRAILSIKSNDLSDDELRDEMALLKEKNKSMEEDLMEMQEKYLDISLKFAEVEGERQQLVMKLRNITNANKSS